MLGDAKYFNVLRNGVTLVSHPINRLQDPDDKSQNARWQVVECEVVNCTAGAGGEVAEADVRWETSREDGTGSQQGWGTILFFFSLFFPKALLLFLLLLLLLLLLFFYFFLLYSKYSVSPSTLTAMNGGSG